MGHMIVSLGAVWAHNAPAYAGYVQRTGIEGYQRTPGNRGAWLLWQVEGDRAEFVTLSFWESRAAIEGFAGEELRVQAGVAAGAGRLDGLVRLAQDRDDVAWPAGTGGAGSPCTRR